MDWIGVALFGLALGFFSSVPVGPGGLLMMDLASRRRMREVAKALSAFMIADILVLCVCWQFSSQITEYLESPIARSISGIFLIIFSYVFLKSVKRKTPESVALAKDPRGTFLKVFNLTLLNPGVWLGIFFVLSLVPGSLLFAVSFEVGVFSWYTILVIYVKELRGELQLKLQRIAARVMLLTGIYYTLMPGIHWFLS